MKSIIWFILVSTLACSQREKTSIDSSLQVGKARIHYKVDGDGEPVLFIHGGYLDLSMWDSQIEDLTKAGFRVIRYSDIGHGKTESGGEDISGCEIVRRLTDELGIEKINIVGLSWGAMIAVDFALTCPEKTDRLILVSPGLNGWQYFADSLAAKNDQIGNQAWKQGDTALFVESFQRNWTDGPRRNKLDVNAEVRETIRSMIWYNLRNHGGENWSKLQSPPAMERLEEVSCPALVVVGEHDVLDIKKIVELLSKKIHNSQTYEIKGAAHTLNMEKPKEFNELVIEFLKKK